MSYLLKRTLFFIKSPLFLIWALVVVIALSITTISHTWMLSIDQILSVSVAASAFPLALLTQQAILRENKRQELRLESYSKLQETTRELSSSLSTLAISSLAEWDKVIERLVSILKATASFTNSYHTYEMVFKSLENEFKYIHFSSQKLTTILSAVSVNINEQRNSIQGFTAEDTDDLLKYKECKELADDILMYLYDLEKDCIKELRFDSLFSVVIENRKPLDKKYRTLRQVATKKAVKALENEVLLGAIKK